MTSNDDIPPALRDRVFEGTEPATVTICTITFNHATFIAQCIEAFLDQRCDFNVEIVIYDDASTDGTADILREYAERFPTIIKPILSERNLFSLGVNPYYAFVFPAARGEFIAICDGDDYWTETEKLAKQVEALRSDPSIAITYGRVFGDLGEGKKVPFTAALERDLSPLELQSVPAINTATTCFRNPYLDATPQFLRHSPIGDQTVWAIVGGMGRGHFMEDLEPVGYRIHAGGIFSEIAKSRKYYMSAIAKLCIAAYHDQNGHSEAEHQVLSQSVSALTTRLGLRRVVWLALRNRIGVLLQATRHRSSLLETIIARLANSTTPGRRG